MRPCHHLIFPQYNSVEHFLTLHMNFCQKWIYQSTFLVIQIWNKVWTTSYSFLSLPFGNHNFIIILILKKFLLLIPLLLCICQLQVGPLPFSILVLAVVLFSAVAPCSLWDQPPSTQSLAGCHGALSGSSLLVSHRSSAVSHSFRTRIQFF